MKKLMIAAAVALAATFANAGAYTWGFGSGADAAPGQVPDPNTGDGYLTGGTAMLFLGTIAQTATGEGSGIGEKYNLDFTGLTQVATADQDGTYYTFGQNEFDPSVTSSAVTTDATQAYTLILFDQSGVTDYENYEGYYYVQTGTSTLAQDPATDTWYARFQSPDAVDGDAWRTASLASPTPPGPDPAPEPTSGLLVLLGVAGLALKRKRA